MLIDKPSYIQVTSTLAVILYPFIQTSSTIWSWLFTSNPKFGLQLLNWIHLTNNVVYTVKKPVQTCRSTVVCLLIVAVGMWRLFAFVTFYAWLLRLYTCTILQCSILTPRIWECNGHLRHSDIHVASCHYWQRW